MRQEESPLSKKYQEFEQMVKRKIEKHEKKVHRKYNSLAETILEDQPIHLIETTSDLYQDSTPDYFDVKRVSISLPYEPKALGYTGKDGRQIKVSLKV